MPRSERAKQFMPFDALKGLKQALRAKEIEYEKKPRQELSEDQSKAISDTLLLLENGDNVSVTYYCSGFNQTASGEVTLKLNDQFIIVDSNIIEIKDIIKIEIK